MSAVEQVQNLFVRKVCNKYSVMMFLLLQYAPTYLAVKRTTEGTSLRPKTTSKKTGSFFVENLVLNVDSLFTHALLKEGKGMSQKREKKKYIETGLLRIHLSKTTLSMRGFLFTFCMILENLERTTNLPIVLGGFSAYTLTLVLPLTTIFLLLIDKIVGVV